VSDYGLVGGVVGEDGEGVFGRDGAGGLVVKGRGGSDARRSMRAVRWWGTRCVAKCCGSGALGMV
jgi:hypothetical protein